MGSGRFSCRRRRCLGVEKGTVAECDSLVECSDFSERGTTMFVLASEAQEARMRVLSLPTVIANLPTTVVIIRCSSNVTVV